MRVEYWCKHCNHFVGSVDRPGWTERDVELHCGLSQLTPVERSESVAYNREHGVMTVQTVCDFCQQALESHPELLVEGKLLQ